MGQLLSKIAPSQIERYYFFRPGWKYNLRWLTCNQFLHLHLYQACLLVDWSVWVSMGCQIAADRIVTNMFMNMIYRNMICTDVIGTNDFDFQLLVRLIYIFIYFSFLKWTKILDKHSIDSKPLKNKWQFRFPVCSEKRKCKKNPGHSISRRYKAKQKY